MKGIAMWFVLALTLAAMAAFSGPTLSAPEAKEGLPEIWWRCPAWHREVSHNPTLGFAIRVTDADASTVRGDLLPFLEIDGKRYYLRPAPASENGVGLYQVVAPKGVNFRTAPNTSPITIIKAAALQRGNFVWADERRRIENGIWIHVTPYPTEGPAPDRSNAVSGWIAAKYKSETILQEFTGQHLSCEADSPPPRTATGLMRITFPASLPSLRNTGMHDLGKLQQGVFFQLDDGGNLTDAIVQDAGSLGRTAIGRLDQLIGYLERLLNAPIDPTINRPTQIVLPNHTTIAIPDILPLFSRVQLGASVSSASSLPQQAPSISESLPLQTAVTPSPSHEERLIELERPDLKISGSLELKVSANGCQSLGSQFNDRTVGVLLCAGPWPRAIHFAVTGDFAGTFDATPQPSGDALAAVSLVKIPASALSGILKVKLAGVDMPDGTLLLTSSNQDNRIRLDELKTEMEVHIANLPTCRTSGAVHLKGHSIVVVAPPLPCLQIDFPAFLSTGLKVAPSNACVTITGSQIACMRDRPLTLYSTEAWEPIQLTSSQMVPAHIVLPVSRLRPAWRFAQNFPLFAHHAKESVTEDLCLGATYPSFRPLAVAYCNSNQRCTQERALVAKGEAFQLPDLGESGWTDTQPPTEMLITIDKTSKDFVYPQTTSVRLPIGGPAPTVGNLAKQLRPELRPISIEPQGKLQLDPTRWIDFYDDMGLCRASKPARTQTRFDAADWKSTKTTACAAIRVSGVGSTLFSFCTPAIPGDKFIHFKPVLRLFGEKRQLLVVDNSRSSQADRAKMLSSVAGLMRKLQATLAGRPNSGPPIDLLRVRGGGDTELVLQGEDLIDLDWQRPDNSDSVSRRILRLDLTEGEVGPLSVLSTLSATYRKRMGEVVYLTAAVPERDPDANLAGIVGGIKNAEGARVVVFKLGRNCGPWTKSGVTCETNLSTAALEQALSLTAPPSKHH